MIGRRILILPLAAVALAATALACASGVEAGCRPADDAPALKTVELVETFIVKDRPGIGAASPHLGNCVRLDLHLLMLGTAGDLDSPGVVAGEDGYWLTDTVPTYKDGKRGVESIRDVRYQFPDQRYVYTELFGGDQRVVPITCTVDSYEYRVAWEHRDYLSQRLTLTGCGKAEES